MYGTCLQAQRAKQRKWLQGGNGWDGSVGHTYSVNVGVSPPVSLKRSP